MRGMGLLQPNDGWRISDALWAKIHPLLPVPVDNHPLGCHRKRVSNRAAMNAILFANPLCSHLRSHPAPV
jgi:transposase